jgi:hypothetical protein
VKSKAKSVIIISLTSSGLFKRNSSWQAKQSVSHTIATFYGDWVKMCEDSAPNFGDKRTGCCITTTQSHTSFFAWEFLSKNNIIIVPHPPYFSLFLRLKVRLKCRHFDTIEVIEARSQTGLNTLTEHDFQDAFKNDRSTGKGKGKDHLVGDGGQ